MRLSDLRLSPWTLLIVGLVAADLFALWVWAAWPPRVYSDWLGLVGQPREAPIPRLIAWAGWESGPRTPSGLVCLFEIGELCFVAVVLVVLCLLIVILVGKGRSEGRLWRGLSTSLYQMKTLAVRFRVRTALLGIAILGLYLGWEIHAWRGWRLRIFYLEQVGRAEGRESRGLASLQSKRKELAKLVEAEAAQLTDDSVPEMGYYRSRATLRADRAANGDGLKREISDLSAWIAPYAERKRKYQLAAANPWAAVAPDEPLPENPPAGHEWASSDPGRALAAYDDLARAYPEYVEAHSGAAWIRATCPDARHRDGKLAVASATRACELTKWRDAGALTVLAAAYAQAGNFPEAVKFQQKVLAMSGQAATGKVSQDLLTLYLAGRAYRSN
jgi:hypothetical protein